MASNSNNYNSSAFLHSSHKIYYNLSSLYNEILSTSSPRISCLVGYMFILNLLFPYTFFDVSTELALLIISLHSPILISYILLSMASPIHLVILQ